MEFNIKTLSTKKIAWMISLLSCIKDLGKNYYPFYTNSFKR